MEEQLHLQVLPRALGQQVLSCVRALCQPVSVAAGGLYGGRDALAVPRGWICIEFIPSKAVVRISPPYSGSGSWKGTSQVNTACAASSGTLQGKTVSLVDPRLEFKWFSGFAAGQLHGAASHCTCLCLSFYTCKTLECALSSYAGLMPL